MLDFGYPQNTDAGALNLVANAEGVRTRDVTREDPRQITTQATEPLSWRRADLRYRKNECYLDVIETLNLLIGSQGTVLRADVDGRVVMRAYLSGMPECKVGLNNELRLEHRAEPAQVAHAQGGRRIVLGCQARSLRAHGLALERGGEGLL